MDKLTEFSQRSEALRYHIARHSVTLVTCANGIPKDLGSGTCIEYDGNFGIATAAHVVLGVEAKDVAVVYKPSATKLNTYITTILLNGGGEGDPLDVAFLQLSKEGVAELRQHKSFLPAARFRPGVSILTDDLFVVYGTPRDFIDDELLKHKHLKAHPMAYITVSLEELPSGLVQSNDLALEYPEQGNICTADGKSAVLPNAKGLSGGGVWVASARKGGIWSPEDAVLVGVEVSWYPRGRWVRGNQIQHVLSLVDSIPKDNLPPDM